ncbi:uncharacterized protein ACLA_090400 [Aspergillus clavatus NRRL 1]|uniref:Uncharacterized protein n=1 Tax=Aspergillus clavatus (strain ATCC 1007 / CBS 513.65 / DSM 816 / NCTC 3887 / NRRL 1 / QM 1276 / 107) TaxID=344612 RepID=A1CEP8_ASPCL|nr:uncharacterized protein ACLA_090400 [Aspergillus clavatus NRRL 1]EAW11347.1 hypothetical protein ACLA_090400 [Aspergillus clavatus NRRL 1]
MKRQGNPLWGRVHHSPFYKNGRWRSILNVIWSVAESLGITLVYKKVDDTDTSGYQPRTPKTKPAIGVSYPLTILDKR